MPLYRISTNLGDRLELFVDPSEMTVGEVKVLVREMSSLGPPPHSMSPDSAVVKLSLIGQQLSIDDALWRDVVVKCDAPGTLIAHVSYPSSSALRPTSLPPAAAIAAQKQEEEQQQRQMATMMQPMLDSMASNPQFFDMLLQMQPELREAIRRNPRLEQELRNPETLKEMLRAGVDPDARRMTERSLSAAMAQISAIPGGQAMLESEVLHALGSEGQSRERSAADLRDVSEERAKPKEGHTANVEQLPNPWGARVVPTPPVANTQPQRPATNVVADEDAKLSLLAEMGFEDRELNRTALRANNGDVDAAVCWLAERE